MVSFATVMRESWNGLCPRHEKKRGNRDNIREDAEMKMMGKRPR